MEKAAETFLPGLRLGGVSTYKNPSVLSIVSNSRTQVWLNETKWSMKQVIAACLWSALIGLGCGYGWLLLQMGGVGC